ncbi:uncharacterized protein BDW70DRAFT_159040 [Aspergillus foveolatus]|uniref:uncharacterized protein n=1 Tax=Aspergillus foveolatus TaxID=210207 RepID=UPI003CCDBE3E
MCYAYRMDSQAFGVREDMIAPNCFGTVPDGTCYFDEFIDFLQRDDYTLDQGKSTSVGKYFWPDAVEAAAELQKLTVAGKEYVPNADQIISSYQAPSPPRTRATMISSV